jgi:thiomorpholine-carboxylate dehydrogenase
MYIEDSQIRQLLTYEALIPEMRQALIAFSSGQVTQPLRNILSIPAYQGRYGVMSAVYQKLMGTKLVSIYPRNAGLKLPTHSSVIHLFSAETGQPLAMLDGDVITEMRTAAVSALAVQLLAPPDARVLSILGAGVQARAHLTALGNVRAFREVYFWNRTDAKAATLAAEMGACEATLTDAVRKADVIVTATSASEPVLQGVHLQKKTVIVSVGAVGPTLRELDDAAMAGTLVADSRQAVQAESGDVILSRAHVYAELGELLSGAKPIPSSDRVIFKSVGIAVEDVAAAGLIYRSFLHFES